MILWPIVALVAVLLLVGAVRYGHPALEHRKHARALAHIARLEIELGIVPAPPPMQSKWEAGVSAAATRYVTTVEQVGVYNRCEQCRTRVRLDTGHCAARGTDRERCARFLYQRNENGPA